MSGLTVSEKQHWKDRLARRIEKKIEKLSTDDPTLMARLKQQARLHALESLGLAALQAELDAVKQEQTQLERREEQARRAMLATVCRVDLKEVDLELVRYSEAKEVTDAIARRQAVHEEELLAADESGRAILRLRQEKEGLLDAIWLATSPGQLKELWQKVGEMLADDPTTLQKDALTIGVPPKE
jgi:hypothetical protein